MKFQIQQNKLRDEVKKKIFDGFGSQAIESTGINGLREDPISFEIFNGTTFVGAIVVQSFWKQLHIKYLFVEKNYRGQGIARQLMDHALEFGIKRGCHFAFVEMMSFQAPEFYQKMGFAIEFSRPGYAENTTFHYLKKPLNRSGARKKIIRIGVYGVVMDKDKILTIRQQRGPYAGKFDFPGGGIEFGESAEQAMCREFAEEVAMEFDSMQLIDNLTSIVDVPSAAPNNLYKSAYVESTERQPSSFADDSRIGITPIIFGSFLSQRPKVGPRIDNVSPENALRAPFSISSSPHSKNATRVFFDSSRVRQKRNGPPFHQK